MSGRDWEALGSQQAPSWYLDPVVARQKRDVYLGLLERWRKGTQADRILKTDLFEEAFGEDRLLPDLFPTARIVLGIDQAFSTARAAADRELHGRVAVSDVRRMGFGAETFDLVVSTSTLDHFTCREDFVASLEEISRILRPGGLLILTLDNPLNPLYAPLRWLSRTGLAPFYLGYTPSIGPLKRTLGEAGFEVGEVDWLLHNPRLISTALFLICRRVFGRRADAPVRFLLRCFGLLSKLPTRRFTACFQAVSARKRGGPDLA